VTTTEANSSNQQQPLSRSLLGGISSLGAASSLERGLTFLSNVLAARLGGAHTFGAYSLALTTANNVASYAGAGIGTTANRFSGEVQTGSPEYAHLVRKLATVSLQSSLLAVAALWLIAGPLASKLLDNPGLTSLLRIAALSSGAMILLECLRGFLIGQRCFSALITLSAVLGCGLCAGVPIAARHGANYMILVQAFAAIAAVVTCVILLRKRFRLKIGERSSAGPSLLSIWRFGAVQLAGVVGLNAAGWWIASLVTRADTTLLQMGFFAAASQLRNMVALMPGLASQGNFALLTDEGGRRFGGASRVLIHCSFLACFLGLLTSSAALVLLPWALRFVYGPAFAHAESACALAIATGLVHMGLAPSAARLTIVSLRFTTVINAGPFLIPSRGASGAAFVFFAAHIISGVLVLVALARRGDLPKPVISASFTAILTAVTAAGLACVRAANPANRSGWTVALMGVMGIALWRTYALAKSDMNLSLSRFSFSSLSRLMQVKLQPELEEVNL
jgi:O-antigen/teichoic acid export membrane protein